jgi:hypothetical protein
MCYPEDKYRLWITRGTAMSSLRDFIGRLLSFLPGTRKQQVEVERPEPVETQPPAEEAEKPSEAQPEEQVSVEEPGPPSEELPAEEPSPSPEPPEAGAE